MDLDLKSRAATYQKSYIQPRFGYINRNLSDTYSNLFLGGWV